MGKFVGRRYEMSSQEMVRAILEDERPRWNAQANDSIVISRVDGSINRSRIRSEIDSLADAGELVQNPAVTAALAAAQARHPLIDFGALAFQKIILDKATELKWDLTSAQNLSDVMDWLLEQQEVPLGEEGREAQQQQRDVERRTGEINFITRNYTAGFKIRTPNGGIKVYDRDGHEIQFSSSGGRAKPRDGGFDAMTDDEISAICEQVRTERRMRGMTKEGLRAEIDPVRHHKYADSSVSLGPNPAGVELVLEGKVITTKRELINAINSANDATKRMLTRNGVTDRTLAKRFEEILNS
jgi:hypothetical protein